MLKKLFIIIFFLGFCSISTAQELSLSELFAQAKQAEKKTDSSSALSCYRQIYKKTTDENIKKFLNKKMLTLTQTTKKDKKQIPTAAIAVKQTILSKAELFSEAKKFQKKGEIQKAIEAYNQLLEKTNDPDITKLVFKNIKALERSTIKDSIEKDENTSFIRLTPLTSKNIKELDKKVSTAKYLISKGDVSMEKGAVEDAFKLYKIALETLQ